MSHILKLTPWQLKASASPAGEVLVAGGPGTGKTTLLLAEALRGWGSPGWSALVLGSDWRLLVEQSLWLYGELSGRFDKLTLAWSFPSGARVFFGGRHQLERQAGRRFQFVGIDGVEWLTLEQYKQARYLVRSGRLIATCERVEGWRAEHFGPWNDGVAFLKAELGTNPHLSPHLAQWAGG